MTQFSGPKYPELEGCKQTAFGFLVLIIVVCIVGLILMRFR